ncbi:MAG: FecR domain-containing protein [Opitutaceae bacterium]
MSADAEYDPTEQRAADWLVRRDRGLSPAQERELTRWLAADARHAAAFKALAETWHLVADLPPILDSNTRSPFASDSPRRTSWWPAVLATAAALAIVAFGVRHRFEPQGTSYAAAAATEVGTWRNLSLPDGSVIQLNTDSVVDVNFEPTLRRVRLVKGEAHFSVAKDPSRPFVVSAAAIDVRVVGTVFNVRLRPESVDVLVTEGKVRVAPPGNPDLGSVSAGQRVSIALGSETAPEVAPVSVDAVEIRQTLAWTTRRLDFDETTLQDIVAEFNRYNRHKLILADPRLKDRRFGGSFPASDHGTFVRMLEDNFGVEAENRPDETRLRLRQP